MRLSSWFVVLSCVTSLFAVSCSTDSSVDSAPAAVFNIDDANAGDLIPGEYIVVFKQGAGIQGAYGGIDAIVRDITTANGISAASIHFVYKKAIQGFAATMSSAQANNMQKDRRVDYVEQDQVMRLIPYAGKPGGGGGTAVAETTPWGITRVGGSATHGTAVAWIIDTGVDYYHDDLNVDVDRARSFIATGPESKNAKDLNGHGTHVSGTIAAKDNTTYVVGVAEGATVVPVKVLNKNGSGTNAGVIAGVDYVAANGDVGDVANMSLGGGASTALDDAVIAAADAGISMVLAAGNSGADAGKSSPSRANGTNIYTISAMDVNDNFASWSNWGNPPVDYCAPGVSVLSLWPGNKTNTISGTSMAAPHVAGILLLGAVTTDGYVNNDPDGTADPIAHR
ncbi:MAG: S8 family serine peptidase [bacterium]|nr:S8 family serine peptidase [bacterium]